MQIAPTQKKQIDLLRDTLAHLESTVGRESRPAFQNLRERLDSWSARIAVIGQVKAGKSTFLNAFLGFTDFLPSDVNPWTSVVTNIHINGTHDPETGSSFEFFNEDDWNEIMDGDNRIRKLAEQLLPGFDTNLLRQQSEEMRDRARSRLGRHYHALLGNKHEYDFVTSDLLKRYVCAGQEGSAEDPTDALGRYSSLTKVARVYMRRPEFLVPAILTDTPGVNDPFLVRDEFTCRSLDHSDVFVVVLSAHQALTEVDIALIRILAQQASKDVLIFVNRIDELDDYAHEVPRVIDDVVTRLSQAIPDIEFTIMAGSAFMAELVLRGDDEAIARLDTPELAAYLQANYGAVPDTAEDRLYLASGLDALKLTLSSVIDNGVGSQKLQQLQQDIRSEIGGVQFSTKRERQSVQMQVEQIGARKTGEAIAAIEADIAKLEEVYEVLTRHFDGANGQIDRIVTKSWAGLEQSLNAAVEGFVDAQKEVLNERIFRDSINKATSKSLSISILPLNGQLNAETRDKYEKSRSGTDVVLSNCLSACRHAIGTRADSLIEAITLDGLPYDEFATTLTLSKKSIELGMVLDRGWAFWRRPSVNVEKSLEALRALAAAELRPAMEKLLKAFGEAQTERAQAGAERIRVLLRTFEASIAERRHRLMRDRRQLDGSDAEAQAQLVHRLQSRLEILERRLQNLSVSDSVLSRALFATAA